jgi:hypothetical protein
MINPLYVDWFWVVWACNCESANAVISGDCGIKVEYWSQANTKLSINFKVAVAFNT